MKYDLGGVVLEVRGVGFATDVEGVFIDRVVVPATSSRSPDVVLEVEVGTRLREDWRRSERLEEDWDAAAGIVTIRVTEWLAEFDLPARRVCARLEGPWSGALESLVKVTLEMYAPVLGKGLALHASAVEKDGIGVVFSGRAETGKSTSARLLEEAGARQLSDEIVFVGEPDGAGRLSIYPLPIRQRRFRGPLADPLPLSGWYGLEQADADEVVALDPARQVLVLSRAIAVGVKSPLITVPAIELAQRYLEIVPLKILRFRKSADFWRVVAADCDGA